VGGSRATIVRRLTTTGLEGSVGSRAQYAGESLAGKDASDASCTLTAGRVEMLDDPRAFFAPRLDP
jgi:hypothetical protein